ITWGPIRVGGQTTPRTRVAGPARIFCMEPQTNEAAFVAHETPNLSPNRGVVAIVAPAATHATSPPAGFERFQGFHREQGTAVDSAEQQQHITRQMSERAVTQLVLAPAPLNFAPVQREALLVPGSLGMPLWERIPLLLKACHLLLEFVNLTARAGLLAIKAAGVEKKGPADLLTVFIHRRRREQRMRAPVGPKHPLNALPLGHFCVLDLDNEIEHREPLSIGS